MARPKKLGLDYFDLDCQMDDKIRLIQAEFGLKGFAVVVKLYQLIYGGFGYYCEWDEDRLFLFMSENGVSSDNKNLIDGIITACIKRHIFSEDLFEKYGILTSSGIQKRYINAVSKREQVEMKKEYLLINAAPNYIKVTETRVSGEKTKVSGVNNPQSRVEKSRVEKSKIHRAKNTSSKLKCQKSDEVYYECEELDRAFKDFIVYRREIKKPMTSKAITLAISALNKLSGNDTSKAIEIINQSILKGWSGFFEIKDISSKNQKAGYKPKVNKFNNFEEREDEEVDMEELARNRLNSKLKGIENR